MPLPAEERFRLDTVGPESLCVVPLGRLTYVDAPVPSEVSICLMTYIHFLLLSLPAHTFTHGIKGDVA